MHIDFASEGGYDEYWTTFTSLKYRAYNKSSFSHQELTDTQAWGEQQGTAVSPRKGLCKFNSKDPNTYLVGLILSASVPKY